MIQETFGMNQQEVLTALGQIGAARRGHISEQWYEHAGKDGRLHRTGPYYVWQRFLHGRKVSVRVPREEATRAQAEVERGRSVEALMCQFWENAEAQAEGKKKRQFRSS